MSENEIIALQRIYACKDSQLAFLDLSGLSLLEVPTTVGELTHLKHLDLRSNELTESPEFLCRLPNLESLWLRYNRLRVLEMSHFMTCKNLVILDIRDNPCLGFPSTMVVDKHGNFRTARKILEHYFLRQSVDRIYRYMIYDDAEYPTLHTLHRLSVSMFSMINSFLDLCHPGIRIHTEVTIQDIVYLCVIIQPECRESVQNSLDMFAEVLCGEIDAESYFGDVAGGLELYDRWLTIIEKEYETSVIMEARFDAETPYETFSFTEAVRLIGQSLKSESDPNRRDMKW